MIHCICTPSSSQPPNLYISFAIFDGYEHEWNSRQKIIKTKAAKLKNFFIASNWTHHSVGSSQSLSPSLYLGYTVYSPPQVYSSRICTFRLLYLTDMNMNGNSLILIPVVPLSYFSFFSDRGIYKWKLTFFTFIFVCLFGCPSTARPIVKLNEPPSLFTRGVRLLLNIFSVSFSVGWILKPLKLCFIESITYELRSSFDLLYVWYAKS